MASWISADDSTHYVNLDMVEMFFASDNGDGTFTIKVAYSDFYAKLDTGTVYEDKASAMAAIASYLGANLRNTF